MTKPARPCDARAPRNAATRPATSAGSLGSEKDWKRQVGRVDSVMAGSGIAWRHRRAPPGKAPAQMHRFGDAHSVGPAWMPFRIVPIGYAIYASVNGYGRISCVLR